MKKNIIKKASNQNPQGNIKNPNLPLGGNPSPIKKDPVENKNQIQAQKEKEIYKEPSKEEEAKTENLFHYEINDFFTKIHLNRLMPPPPSYVQKDPEYAKITQTVKEKIEELNYFVLPIPAEDSGQSGQIPQNSSIMFDVLCLLNDSLTIRKENIFNHIFNIHFPETTYIRPFYNVGKSPEEFGITPISKFDFIFLLMESILEHYAFKKPELIQSMLNALDKDQDTLFPFLKVSLSAEQLNIIKTFLGLLLSKAKNFPRKQYPTPETYENSGDVFSLIDVLLLNYVNSTGSIKIPEVLALMNFGIKIAKRTSSLIPNEERTKLNYDKVLGNYLLVARQLCEAFRLTIEFYIIDSNSIVQNNQNVRRFRLKCSDSKLISPIFIFLTCNLNFAGKLTPITYYDTRNLNDMIETIKQKYGQLLETN